jgi:hypothetical protein
MTELAADALGRGIYHEMTHRTLQFGPIKPMAEIEEQIRPVRVVGRQSVLSEND